MEKTQWLTEDKFMKCLNCGGDLDFTSDGKYRCPFCRKVFSKLEIENVPTRQNLKYGDDKGINVFDKNINLRFIPNTI